MINKKFEAILFDFDGTLADTSFDMVNCLNILLKKHSIPEVSSDVAKNYISKGAGGLIDFSCPDLSENKRISLTNYLISNSELINNSNTSNFLRVGMVYLVLSVSPLRINVILFNIKFP